jgi:hypothetical protein
MIKCFQVLLSFNLRRYSPVQEDVERAGPRVRAALIRAESLAAAADGAENATACTICLTQPKDTALNCGYVHVHPTYLMLI